MRQEIKFCADVYRLIYDHIDTASPIYLCLDGSATARGVREGILADASMPDFFWRFKGGALPFLMEAKVVLNGEVTFCGDGQPAMWCPRGTGTYKPILWLGIDELSSTFYAWEQVGFDESLSRLVGRGRTSSGKKKTLKATVSANAQSFETIVDLVEYVVRYAKQRGFYP